MLFYLVALSDFVVKSKLSILSNTPAGGV